MKQLNTLALAVSLLVGSQAAHALTPWTTGFATPDVAVYTSGGAAQDKAYGQVVTTTLAAPGTVDIFSDVDPATGSVGARWTAYYFTGNANLGAGLAGKKILLEKRSYGAAGYGVVPLLAASGAGLPIEHLKIQGLQAADWDVDGTVGGKKWKKTIDTGNASKYLFKKVSDGGFLGVDPEILLKPGTENYPGQVNEVSTGLPEAGWPLTLSALPKTGNLFTVVPTGGLVYGVAVTLDLYKVLQAAQKRAGILPSTVVVGSYSEASLPKLNRNVIASLLAGKVGAWNQIKIVDKTDGNKVKTLLDTTILASAGVTAPYKEATTGKNLTPVAVAKRNKGAAIGAVAYAKFLNYPGTKNSFAPGATTPDNAVDEDATLPIVKAPGGAADTGNLLKDWQNGTNATGYNNVLDVTKPAKRWGIAVNSADRNSSVLANGTGGDPWRYIKIDGYAPTLENVAAGVYPHWAEGAVLYRTSKGVDPLWAVKTKLLKAFANDLGSPTVANAVNTTQAWGKTGIFATTADPRGFTASIPFNYANPVVPLTHFNGGSTHADIVPVADRNAKGGLSLQLK
ncbi:MAG: hypothetical protein PHH59_09755 [Methylovulum sp.]|uniref:hypothetical protein n=1 Tax=Methylovulum sp. TaxID=1916980 RepID=UPI002607CD49|nr:hypothetical protein [Methylovulum sp.]MDD2724290.1 hypothetical protein [Methylovulum sp.]MDD5122977.1 hypothetical protein [Methylovulum sp.]